MTVKPEGRLFSLDESEIQEPYEGDLPWHVSPFQQRSVSEGAEFDEIAFSFVEQAGGELERVGGEADGIPIDGIIKGRNGSRFLLAAHGTIDSGPKAGLLRVDTVHKVGHRASLISSSGPPLIVLTSHLPAAGTKAAFYLARSGGDIFDVIATAGDLAGFHRLQRYLTEVPALATPLAAPWRAVVRQGSFGSGEGEPNDA